MAEEDQTNQHKPEEPTAGGPTHWSRRRSFNSFRKRSLKWIAVPEDAIIPAPIRKRDVDNLMLGLFRLADAQSTLDTTLVHWSNNRPQEANQSLARFRYQNAEGQNRLRQFLAAIIASFPDPA
jgi:hypothetical protein